MKKRRAFTLLEVMIALSLTALLLTAILSSATRLFTFRHRLEGAKQEVLAKKLIQERLYSLFASRETANPLSQEATPPKNILTSKKGKSLSLRLENTIDPDPNFCGSCEAHLEVDGEKQLFLLTLIGKNGQDRQEVLLEKVSDMQFEFFDFTAGAKGFVEEWKDQGSDLPAIIRLTLESSAFGQNKKASFAFFLNAENNFIVYSKEEK